MLDSKRVAEKLLADYVIRTDTCLNLVPKRVFHPTLALTRNMANGDPSSSYTAIAPEPLKVPLNREKNQFSR